MVLGTTNLQFCYFVIADFIKGQAKKYIYANFVVINTQILRQKVVKS